MWLPSPVLGETKLGEEGLPCADAVVGFGGGGEARSLHTDQAQGLPDRGL